MMRFQSAEGGSLGHIDEITCRGCKFFTDPAAVEAARFLAEPSKQQVVGSDRAALSSGPAWAPPCVPAWKQAAS